MTCPAGFRQRSGGCVSNHAPDIHGGAASRDQQELCGRNPVYPIYYTHTPVESSTAGLAAGREGTPSTSTYDCRDSSYPTLRDQLFSPRAIGATLIGRQPLPCAEGYQVLFRQDHISYTCQLIPRTRSLSPPSRPLAPTRLITPGPQVLISGIAVFSRHYPAEVGVNIDLQAPIHPSQEFGMSLGLLSHGVRLSLKYIFHLPRASISQDWELYPSAVVTSGLRISFEGGASPTPMISSGFLFQFKPTHTRRPYTLTVGVGTQLRMDTEQDGKPLWEGFFSLGAGVFNLL